jgi:hypothetical protein
MMLNNVTWRPPRRAVGLRGEDKAAGVLLEAEAAGEVDGGVRTARRLADYVVLAHDPAVRSQAVDFWEISQPHYQLVVREIASGASPAARERLEALAREPASLPAYWAFVAAVTVNERLSKAVRDADQQILIDHKVGSDYREDPLAGVSRQELSELPAGRPGAVPADALAQIVIPFGDDASGGRVRNVLACLRALRDQSAPRHDYTVTVVESSAAPLWQSLIEPVTDVYLFARKPGAFNKSWAVNVGVASSPRRHRFRCVLDSDILVDRHFVRRNTDRLTRGDHVAHLPFAWAFNLGEQASSWAIRHRVIDGNADVPLEALRGFLKRGSPGGCLWVTDDAFHRVAGFDERFEGWGGEDDDVDARLAQAGPFRRWDDPLLHLHHPRPPMTDGRGNLLNARIEQASWPAGSRYGDINRYDRT